MRKYLHAIALVGLLVAASPAGPPQDNLAPGLIGEYYDIAYPLTRVPTIRSGATPFLRRVDAQINFGSTTAAFPGAKLVERFAVQWTGLIHIPQDGKYTFKLESDDGSKLWIDDVLVVNHDGLHGMDPKTGARDLKAGYRKIRIGFFENTGGAGCRLFWSAKDLPMEIVPAKALFHKKKKPSDNGKKKDESIAQRWKLLPTQYVRYRAYVPQLRGKEEVFIHDPAWRVGLFGYEIEGNRIYHPDLLDWKEIPLIVGLSHSKRSLRVGQKARIDMTLDRGWDYQPLLVKGEIKRLKSDVGQSYRLKAKIFPGRVSELRRQKDISGGFIEAEVDTDADLGVVTRLRFKLELVFPTADPAKPNVQKHTREVRFIELLTPRHTHFNREVNEAIDRGIASIWRGFNNEEGHWGKHYAYEKGPTALALLTILKGTKDRKDERIQRAIKWFLEQPLTYTYEVGIGMMMIEAYYSPTDPARRFGVDGSGDKDLAGLVSPEHKDWMTRATRWMLDKQRNGWWGYPRGADFSNTQYAVLGLLAAQRCGVRVEDNAVFAAFKVYLETQQKKGTREKISITQSAAATTAQKISIRARGWAYGNYADVEGRSSTSMTCGGIGCLAILESMLRTAKSPHHTPQVQKEANDSMLSGWAWLAKHWSVKRNFNRGRNMFYSLYGLERAGMLGGVTRISGHDWYWEGAMFLLDHQYADGHWAAFHDTCFAILFLKRATIRVATGGSK